MCSSDLKSEYLRSSETVNRWQNMVTIIRYSRMNSLSQVIPEYLSTVRAYTGANDHPVWIVPQNRMHAQEEATRLVLSTADQSDVEYVIAYFFGDNGKPAYAVILSQHVPLPPGRNDSMASYRAWLVGMRAIPAASITR